MKEQAWYQTCVEGLHDFAKQLNFTDVVIGLSGGMDSALVAVICVDVFGPGHVHGITIPGPFSSKGSVSDSLELAKNLGITCSEVSINGAYQSLAQELSPLCAGSFEGVASENTQARLRMVCLMALSNAHGWMMVNTGNKSESALGYSTLYGDTAGAYAPIGGLYKTDVYAVARWRNEEAERKGDIRPIPENIFTKPPSAELAPDQKDETSLGVDYETLDAILKALVEEGSSIEDIVKNGYSNQLVEDIVSRYKASEFKRKLEPPFPVIGY